MAVSALMTSSNLSPAPLANRRLGALKDSTGIGADLTPGIRNVDPVAHQPTDFSELAQRIRGGDP